MRRAASSAAVVAAAVLVLSGCGAGPHSAAMPTATTHNVAASASRSASAIRRSPAGRPKWSDPLPETASAYPDMLIPVVVEGGHVLIGVGVARVRPGALVAIRALSDSADTLILEGTHVELSLAPNVPSTIMVRAVRAGSYRGYLLRAHRALFQILVS